MRPDRSCLLVILGPTGSGKSALAHETALARNGEVISADAFAVYRGLDVGTAKPGRKEREEVRYHLVDVAEPSEPFSAGRWQKEARAAVEAIAERGRLPIVCGGSGFYLEALLEGLPAGEARDERLRAALDRWSAGRPEAAHRFLAGNDPAAAARIPVRNRKYTIRALEILLVTGRPPSSRLAAPDGWSARFRVVKIGLAPKREDLYARIAKRVREMLESGWGDEVGRLLERGVPPDSNAFQAIGYRELIETLSGRSDPAETERKIVTATRRLAKRQRTWFARERNVVWVEPAEAPWVIQTLLDAAYQTEKRG